MRQGKGERPSWSWMAWTRTAASSSARRLQHCRAAARRARRRAADHNRGRPDPPIPPDVPAAHPLRIRVIVRTLDRSPWAGDAVKADMERELKRLLHGTPSEQDLLGLVTAAGGGLSGPDLAELTALSAYEVEENLHTVVGRTFTSRESRWRPGTAPPVYVLGHEELQVAATGSLGPARALRTIGSGCTTGRKATGSRAGQPGHRSTCSAGTTGCCTPTRTSPGWFLVPPIRRATTGCSTSAAVIQPPWPRSPRRRRHSLACCSRPRGYDAIGHPPGEHRRPQRQHSR